MKSAVTPLLTSGWVSGRLMDGYNVEKNSPFFPWAGRLRFYETLLDAYARP
jgi:hypothetical protein